MKRSIFRIAPALAALILLLGAFACAEETVPAKIDREKALVVLQKYCYDCHGDGASKGEVKLDELQKLATNDHTDEWYKVWKITRHGFMPPAGKPQPTPDERKVLVNWFAQEKLGVDFAHPDPGRVTLRRLNRMEYEYSMTDLFGVNLNTDQDFSADVHEGASARLKLRDRLPPDETAFGFDNIGDFLTVPPALFERYFEISEMVVQRVVVLDGPKAPEQKFSDFKLSKDEKLPRNTQTASFKVAKAGSYRVEFNFRLGGWQDYGGGYDFKATLDESVISNEPFEVGGDKTYRYTATLDLKAGAHTLTLITEAKKANSDGKLFGIELHPTVRVTGPLDPKEWEYPEGHRNIFFKGEAPKDPVAKKAYAREIIERFATRAFRRPVNEETLNGLLKLAEQSPQFERGIAQALTAIITSPKFLFRSETQPQPNDPKVVHPLDEFALASRLSYLLWLSLPDDELITLASKGQLRANLHAQVKRLLDDPKSERFFEDFPGQWLRTRNVLMTPITMKSEKDVNPVRGAMKKETEMLFEHIARNDRDLIELITADYTFVDKKLAEFYGLPEVKEKGFQKVALGPETHRGGLLTHSSFLLSTSNPNRTSPVKRGTFVLENLLGVEVPPPPPNVPALDDVNIGDTSKMTGRALLAAHREAKSCAACHAHFDPIGIALENFDVFGKWRTTDNGNAIDTTETSVTGEKLTGLKDVQDLFVKHKDRLYNGIAEKLFIYALGRGLEPSDAVTTDRMAARLMQDGGKFSSLLYDLVDSPAFLTRRGDALGSKASLKSFVPPTPPPEKRRPIKRRKKPVDEEVDAPAADPNAAKPAQPAPPVNSEKKP